MVFAIDAIDTNVYNMIWGLAERTLEGALERPLGYAKTGGGIVFLSAYVGAFSVSGLIKSCVILTMRSMSTAPVQHST